jgi:hypothetical protein
MILNTIFLSCEIGLDFISFAHFLLFLRLAPLFRLLVAKFDLVVIYFMSEVFVFLSRIFHKVHL